VANTVADQHLSALQMSALPAREATNRHPAAPDRSATEGLRRLDHARTVLEAARAVIERGWLQRGWYVSPAPQPRSIAARLLRPDRSPGIDEVHQACLVAAVALAADGGGARPDVIRDAGPMLDIVWDAMLEASEGRWIEASGRAAPPEVRIARIRELVRWNDAAGRTRDEVLALLDRAISRTILTAMRPAAHPS
jgi:hypothetical protein